MNQLTPYQVKNRVLSPRTKNEKIFADSTPA
jgi:hypothetical protein